MPTSQPPSRYRVVERGRRLEVVDTHTGAPVTSAPVTAQRVAAGRWPTLPEQAGFDGRAVLDTHRWYDRKAPRRVLLDGGTVQRIGAAKGVAVAAAILVLAFALTVPIVLSVLLLPLALLRAPVRERLRTAATGWLDRFDSPPGR